MKAVMHNNQRWVTKNQLLYPEDVMVVKLFNKILEECGFGVVNYMEHRFKPEGFTSIWLLSESHLAIHTFPEEEKLYVEMSSCVKKPFDKYIKIMNECFGDI